MISITPPKIFSKEVAQNRPPYFPARTSSPPEIVSDQISGDGAWMNFRFSRAPPQRARTRPPWRFRGIPIRAGPRRERDHLFAYAVTLASLYDCAKKTYKLVTRRQG